MTNTQRDAMQQALDALEISLQAKCADQPDSLYLQERDKHRTAIAALRQALAEPEVEPVAWLRVDEMKAMCASEKEVWISSGNESVVEDYTVPLYTSPTPPAEVPLLSAAEILDVMRDGNNCNYNDEAEHVDFARAIEQAVRQRAVIK